MKILTLFAVPALFLTASNAAAQSNSQSHEQHQAPGQPKIADADKRCCCSEEMHKMMMQMMQMMQKHSQMGTSPSATKPAQPAPAPDQHRHQQ